MHQARDGAHVFSQLDISVTHEERIKELLKTPKYNAKDTRHSTIRGMITDWGLVRRRKHSLSNIRRLPGYLRQEDRRNFRQANRPFALKNFSKKPSPDQSHPSGDSYGVSKSLLRWPAEKRMLGTPPP
jgi:hypothetical protein